MKHFLHYFINNSYGNFHIVLYLWKPAINYYANSTLVLSENYISGAES